MTIALIGLGNWGKNHLRVLKKLNLLDVINALNILGKVDYSRIQPYYELLSPYQTPTVE